MKNYYHAKVTNPVCVCGKVSFHKKDAQTKKNKLERDGRGRLRIYQCPVCNLWHLTHKLKK